MPKKDDFLDIFGGYKNDKPADPTEPVPYSEEEYFMQTVAPILAQLKEACEARNLPVVATIAYEYVAGQGYHAAVLAHMNNNPPGRVPGHFPIVYHFANGGTHTDLRPL